MKKALTAVAATALALGLTAAPVAHAATPATAPAAKSDYSKKKQNQFWRTAKRVDPFVKYIGKKTTVDLGVATCDLLRAGGTMYDLVFGLVETDMGVAEDTAIAIIAAAPVVLCPDQQYKFE